MRAGILANSLPSALAIYDELKSIPDCCIYILLGRTPGGSSLHNLGKHLARLLFKAGRLRSLSLIFSRRVFLFHEPLDHPSTLEKIRKLDLDVGLHKAGVIYREATIDAFRLGILNPHIGILPEYRGRSVMEWALIQGGPLGITVFFIDAGIDTGERVVLSEEVDISHCKSIDEAKQHLFGLDAIYFRRALELLGSEDFQFKLNDGSGRRYYVMSGLFRKITDEILKN